MGAGGYYCDWNERFSDRILSKDGEGGEGAIIVIGIRGLVRGFSVRTETGGGGSYYCDWNERFSEGTLRVYVPLTSTNY